jgi:hypothetical protein
MKSILSIVASSIIAISSAHASSGASSDENGLLVNLFLVFGGVIIAFQLIPAVVLFSSLLKGIFAGTKEEVHTSK